VLLGSQQAEGSLNRPDKLLEVTVRTIVSCNCSVILNETSCLKPVYWRVYVPPEVRHAHRDLL
jgi:hypothetical protein